MIYDNTFNIALMTIKIFKFLNTDINTFCSYAETRHTHDNQMV